MEKKERKFFIKEADYILTFLQESDGGEKSDGDLVVDVGNEDEPPRQPMAINGDHRDSTGGNGSNGGDRRPPSNLSSSSRSTPSAKPKDGEGQRGEGKPGTPSGSSKPTTPNGHQQPNGKPPTPGMPGYPPGFPLRPGGPGAELPLGYPYQNGVPPGLPGAFPPRPPLVIANWLLFLTRSMNDYDVMFFCSSLELIRVCLESCHPMACQVESPLVVNRK